MIRLLFKAIFTLLLQRAFCSKKLHTYYQLLTTQWGGLTPAFYLEKKRHGFVARQQLPPNPA
jgi:hypothetical protein